MSDLLSRKTRAVFYTGGVVRERGKLRQVAFEAKPQYMTLWLKGTRTKFDISYDAVYGLAARKAAEQARAEKRAAKGTSSKRKPGLAHLKRALAGGN